MLEDPDVQVLVVAVAPERQLGVAIAMELLNLSDRDAWARGGLKSFATSSNACASALMRGAIMPIYGPGRVPLC